jgi:regulator of protease activity HflC (stomatin/prohibitin superfamily)
MSLRGKNVSVITIVSGVFLGICVFGLVLAATFFTRSVDAGKVGVVQYKPFFFGKGGIDKKVVMGPDRLYIWPLSTSIWEISLAPVTVTAHAEDFMTSDRIPLDFDIAVTFKVTDNSGAAMLVEKFGAYPVQVFQTLVLQSRTSEGSSTGELMSHLRDRVRHYHSSEFIAAQKADGTDSDATSSVEKSLREHINAFLAKAGAGMISVENIALGRANPPKGVMDAINATAQNAQEVKTQFERKKAQDARKEAEIASAAADRAYQEELKLPMEAWVELKRFETWAKVCSNGNCTFVNGVNTGVNLQVPPKQ